MRRLVTVLLVCVVGIALCVALLGCLDDKPTKCGTGPEEYYIGNVNTKIFHRPCCSYLPYEENRIHFDTWEEAAMAGYRPCRHCDP